MDGDRDLEDPRPDVRFLQRDLERDLDRPYVLLRDREGERLKWRLFERNADGLLRSSERERDLERARFFVDFEDCLLLDFDRERELDVDRNLFERGRLRFCLSEEEYFLVAERDVERDLFRVNDSSLETEEDFDFLLKDLPSFSFFDAGDGDRTFDLK